MAERKTVFIVIEASTHFPAIIAGVTAQMRINRIFWSPTQADAHKAELERINAPGAVYCVEQMEVM